MIEIIPTILVKEFDEVKEKIKQVEKYVNWIQLDIMDGIFVNNETWPSYAKDSEDNAFYKKELNRLKKLKTRVKKEAHLMVVNPKQVIDRWLDVVDRIIIHYEADYENESDIKELIKKVHKKGREIGIALNPETHWGAIKEFLNELDLVLCMTVNPGWGGQEFKQEVLEKIKSLREAWPNGNIEVDGGINLETAKKCIQSEANLICSGSYIFNNQNIEQSIKDLKKL